MIHNKIPSSTISPLHHPIFLLLSFILLLIPCASSLSLTYCSSQNLGSDSTSDQYMSNGYCQDYCRKQGYAVAILSRFDCFCSNDVPADQIDLSDCDTSCPGYPDEKCGDEDHFGYLVFGEVDATVGGESSSTKAQTETDTDTDTSTDTNTETDAAETTSTSSASRSTSSSTTPRSTSSPRSTPPSSTPTSTTTSPSSQQTAMVTRTTQVTQVHLSNDVIKVTEYYTVTPSSSSTSQSSSTSSSPSSPSVVSSTVVLISTQVKASTVFSVVTLNGTQSQQQVSTMYITQSANSTLIKSSPPTDESSTTNESSASASSEAILQR